jgi:hypothetical protein
MKTTLKSSFLALIIMAFALSAIAADCDGDVVKDPNFRQWCGNTLCQWKLDSGHIEKAPTWSEIDFGVSFLDTPTQISQDTDETSAKCLVFTSVADVDPAAQVSILVDFDADGTVDFTAPLTGTKFQQVKAEITAPLRYYRIRFMIQKLGMGRAVLAQMQIKTSTTCTAPPVMVKNLPIGAACDLPAECLSGVCSANGGICSECSDQVDPPPPFSGPMPCASGVKCTARGLGLPFQCAPGTRAGVSNAECIEDDDCESGACVGGTRPMSRWGADAGGCAEGDTGGLNLCYAIGGRCR